MARGMTEMGPFFPDYRPTDLAILDFATHPTGRDNRGLRRQAGQRGEQPIIIGDKYASLWAATITHVADTRPIDEIYISEAWKYAWHRGRDIYQYARRHSELDIDKDYELDREWFRILHNEFADKFEINLDTVRHNAHDSLERLTKEGLIEDPLDFGLLSLPGIMILGFVPYRFNRKTKNGATFQIKIDSLFLTYSKTVRRGTTIYDVNFRAMRFLRAFKKALQETAQEETRTDR